jgi:hypothetical protein
MSRRAPSPPPRWVRRTLPCAPVVGATICVVAVFLTHPTIVDIVTVPLCLLALLCLGGLAVRELRAERHATPEMTACYGVLARLLDDASDGGVLVDDEDQVAFLLIDERTDDGRSRRAFRRFDRDELAEASETAGAPAVYHQFTLDTFRPVVRHRIGAITITRDENGHARMTDVPAPRQRRRDLLRTAHMIARTGADIPPVDSLDELIVQLQSSSTPTA